jgi:hypothetical protein
LSFRAQYKFYIGFDNALWFTLGWFFCQEQHGQKVKVEYTILLWGE